jgi:hypothetical protein
VALDERLNVYPRWSADGRSVILQFQSYWSGRKPPLGPARTQERPPARRMSLSRLFGIDRQHYLA